jgi:hypothetical protein
MEEGKEAESIQYEKPGNNCIISEYKNLTLRLISQQN